MERDNKVSWDILILVLMVLSYTNYVLYDGQWKSVRDSLNLFADNNLRLGLVKYYIIRAFCCYVITVRFPKGFWFVPLLFNFSTISLILVPGFWKIPFGWLFAFSGIALSFIASIIGMWIANRAIKSKNLEPFC